MSSTESTDTNQFGYAKSEILEDLRSVADVIGFPPRKKDFVEHGEIHPDTVTTNFESWKAALSEAGLDPEERKRECKYSKSEILEELRSVAEELGRSPKTRDFLNKNIHRDTVIRRFGSWNTALEKAGLSIPERENGSKPPQGGKPPQRGRTEKISTEELLTEILRVTEELGKVPEFREMDEHSDYSISTYRRRFDTWNNAVKRADLEPANPPKVSGESHPMWKENTAKDYYGKLWSEMRSKRLERDNHKCLICGISQDKHIEKVGKDLHIHHIKPVCSFENVEDAHKISNLRTVCASCHMKWEGLPIFPE